MYTCRVCKFECTQDDAVAPEQENGTCICIACYAAFMGQTLHLPKFIQRTVEQVTEGK